MQARLPLVDAFILSGGVEGRYPDLPTESAANSVAGNFLPSALPGLNAQPTYIHSNAGFILRARHLFEPTIKGGSRDRPLYLVHRDAITPEAEFSYHWNKAGSSSAASLQQLIASANLSIELGATTEGYVVSADVKGFWCRTYYQYAANVPLAPETFLNRPLGTTLAFLL